MIVRELVTKLGFKIDSKKLQEYKRQLASLQAKARVNMPVNNDAKQLASSFQQRVDTKFNRLQAYYAELTELSSTERREILKNNQIEKQAIRETTAEVKAKEKVERQALASNERGIRNIRRSYRELQVFSTRALAITSTAFGLTIRSSFKEFKQFQDNLKQGLLAKTTLTPTQIKQFQAFDTVLESSKIRAAKFRNEITSAFMPTMERLLKSFNQWYDANQNVIRQELPKYIKVLTAGFAALVAIKVGGFIAGTANAMFNLAKMAGLVATGAFKLAKVISIANLSTVAMAGGAALLTGGLLVLLGSIAEVSEGGKNWITDLMDGVSNLKDYFVNSVQAMSDSLLKLFGLLDSDKFKKFQESVSQRKKISEADRIKPQGLGETMSQAFGFSPSFKSQMPANIYSAPTPNFAPFKPASNSSSFSIGDINITVSSPDVVDIKTATNVGDIIGAKVRDAIDKGVNDASTLTMASVYGAI